jgi:hypothetical protein
MLSVLLLGLSLLFLLSIRGLARIWTLLELQAKCKLRKNSLTFSELAFSSLNSYCQQRQVHLWLSTSLLVEIANWGALKSVLNTLGNKVLFFDVTFCGKYIFRGDFRCWNPGGLVFLRMASDTRFTSETGYYMSFYQIQFTSSLTRCIFFFPFSN